MSRSGRGSDPSRARTGAKGRVKPGTKPGVKNGGKSGVKRGVNAGARRERELGGGQVEGRQAVRELLLGERRRIRELLISSDLEGDRALDDIVQLAAARRVPVQYVARRRIEQLARSETPQGVVAVADAVPELTLDDLIGARRAHAPLFVAIDGVTDPGNLGAILRSCEGAGVDGVILPRHRAAHLTPTVAKAAAGAIEYLSMAVVAGLPAALSRLREAGIWLVGLDDGADRTLFELGDLAREGICLVMGAEGSGLSRLVRDRCDLIVGIPMRGRLSSLNVSAAAALATYEVVRTRRLPAAPA